jgi:hypothetical protein
MSVCTGAFLLAKTGLLSGKAATTHHGAYTEVAMAYPDILVKRGARFVESGNLASSGVLSSGIDLALHVVERYFGHRATSRLPIENEGRPLRHDLKKRAIAYVSGIAPSMKLGVYITVWAANLFRNYDARDASEIKWLPVLGVRIDPFIAATPRPPICPSVRLENRS